MRTRMTNNVRKQALHALRPERGKLKNHQKDAIKKSTGGKRERKLSRRTNKGGKTAKYKEVHAVGRRSFSQFVTYSQDGRLFYDLYARHTPYKPRVTIASGTSNPITTGVVASLSPPKRTTRSNALIRSTETRSSSRKPIAASKGKDTRVSEKETKSSRKLTRKAQSKRSNSVPQRSLSKKINNKKETAKVKLERKLKRELGVDSIPHIEVASKRLASMNAVAIINAVTKDSTKRIVSLSKAVSVRRRYSVDTVPCVEDAVEQLQDSVSVLSDDALTEPMRMSPQIQAVSKAVGLTPSTPTVTASCVSQPSSKSGSVVRNESKSRKCRSSNATPTIQRRKPSPPVRSVSTSIPNQELVPTKPQTSAVESYHSEQLIPLGPSSFGFQQITTQFIRYAQPDSGVMLNTNHTPTHAPSTSLTVGSSSTPAVMPVAIHTPGEVIQNMHSPDVFGSNRSHALLGSVSLPVLTPMPAVAPWPTFIHPYTHMVQPMHAHLPYPNSTILIPVPSHFQCSVMPNMVPQVEQSTNIFSLPTPAASPMCNLSSIQPTMPLSFGLIRTVPPSLYYTTSPISYPVRNNPIPLPAPTSTITTCVSSALGLQPSACNQPIFPTLSPTTMSVPMPNVSQAPQLIPSLAVTVTETSQLGAFPAGSFTVPSTRATNPLNDQIVQSTASKIPTELLHIKGAPAVIPDVSDPNRTIISIPATPTMNIGNETFSDQTDSLVVRSKPVETTNSMSVCMPPTISLSGLDTPKSDLSRPNEELIVDPVIVCPVDGSQNAWQWEGSSFEKAIFFRSDGPPAIHTCYPAIRHCRDGMVIRIKDCVLLCSGPDRSNPPHVAKITSLFVDPKNPETKMMSLLWYYRPEHIGCSRTNLVPNELYASRHCDTNPVDCIEDKAYVLTASAFARYMAQLKYRQTPYPRTPLHCVVPSCSSQCSSLEEDETVELPIRSDVQDLTKQFCWSDDVPETVSPANVFLCRGVYDYRLKRVCRNVSLPMLPIHSHFLANRHRLIRSSPVQIHSSSSEDTNESNKPESLSVGQSPRIPSVGLSESPLRVPVDTVSSNPCQTHNSRTSSPEPSPTNSPSLFICLPDSPNSNSRSEELVKSPVANRDSSSTAEPSRNDVTRLQLPSPSVPSNSSERSSTPLKRMESASILSTTSSISKSLPLTPDVEHKDKIHNTDAHLLYNNVISATSILTPPVTIQPVVIASNHANPVWIPSNSTMPLLESSVLETSADLSVNWAEHGEQIALSLDCRVNKPISMVPTSSNNSDVTDSLDQIHQSLPTGNNLIAWPSQLDRPAIHTDLFQPTQQPVLCPSAGSTTSSSGVANSHESDMSRLVML